MSSKTTDIKTLKNAGRRKLLQGAVCMGTAGFAPAVLSLSSTAISAGTSNPGKSATIISGRLICKNYDPVKTLVLYNPTDETVVIEHIAQGAFMYDGNITDCGTACQASPITIPPHQEIDVQFDRRQQFLLTRRIEELRRIQSRVTRLNDGTRVIPFTANVIGTSASIA